MPQRILTRSIWCLRGPFHDVSSCDEYSPHTLVRAARSSCVDEFDSALHEVMVQSFSGHPPPQRYLTEKTTGTTNGLDRQSRNYYHAKRADLDLGRSQPSRFEIRPRVTHHLEYRFTSYADLAVSHSRWRAQLGTK
jgi:hypothetical protein